MAYIKLNGKEALKFISVDPVDYQDKINEIHQMIHEKTGPGSDFLGWVNLPITKEDDEIREIKKAAYQIQKNGPVLVVIGIGGSYLGAKAALDYLRGEEMPKREIIFAGHNLSSNYMTKLLKYLDNVDYSINVISKSGTTIEPAIAFRILREHLIQKYGRSESKNRIFVTTDPKKGALFTLASQEGYPKFVIPSDVGGRFSVLTAVGLLPIAVAGYDIDEIINGATHAYKYYFNADLKVNEAYRYALLRYLLNLEGKKIEVLANYEPELGLLGEWWKQLFGESEGKDHKGLFPANLNFTTDLHALGQYVQDGQRLMFETVLKVKESSSEIKIPFEPDDLDKLNYLFGKNLSYVNEVALEGTMKAHIEGGVPNILIEIPELSPYSFGYLIYFFEKACAMSGYLLGVNPFNQPGVVNYKEKMLELLGKN